MPLALLLGNWKLILFGVVAVAAVVYHLVAVSNARQDGRDEVWAILSGFYAAGGAVIAGSVSDAVVGFAWVSASLFLLSSGIYVGTALLRKIN